MVAMLAPSLPLRAYQREAIDAVMAAFLAGINRPLVVKPTGTGKTVTFTHLIRERPGRALVLAHRDELIEQAADKMRQVSPGIDIGIVKAGQNETQARVVIASVQTLSNRNRLAQFPRDAFETIVIDEAHHATAVTYRRILDWFGAFAPGGGPLVAGFTATPQRGDGTSLHEVWQKIVYHKQLREMVDAGYLVEPRGLLVRVAGLDLSRVRDNARTHDFDTESLDSIMRHADVPGAVARAYLDHAVDRKGIVFAHSVGHSRECAEALIDVGIAAEHLDGAMPTDARRGILRRLKSGETQVVCNYGVLTEGFDEPSLSCIVMARPTKNKSLYMQCIGRGTRRHAGKDDLLVLDVVGISTIHDLVTLEVLLPPRPKTVGAAPEMQSRGSQIEAPAEAFDGDLETEQVDLFTGRRLKWQSIERYGALPLEDGMLIMIPRGDRYAVYRSERGVQALTLLTSGLDEDYALGFAEDYARAHGVKEFLDPNARWRRKPASQKQIDALMRWGVTVPAGISAGDASDRLDLASLQTKLRQLERAGRL